MVNGLKVKTGPQFYLYEEGGISKVSDLLKSYGAKRVLVTHGTVSWEKALPKLVFLNDETIQFFYHRYSGECSYAEARRISTIIKKNEIDFVVGVGGGKLTDLVGYSANLARIDFGVIPTLASNCAPWTPLAVMYKENGQAEGKTEHFYRQAAFFITDPQLVIDSPVPYFIAGLADTLAKWYESELILEQDFLQDESFLKLAQDTAKICKEEILNHSAKAIQDMAQRKLTSEFKQLSEIIFAVAGLVGGLGDKYARNAAAHAMHDAISKYIPESHRFLHGEKVAYGIFYQLALEGRWEKIDELYPLYRELELPVSLEQMGLFPKDKQIIDKMAEFIDSKEKVHLIPIEVTQKSLIQSMMELEGYIRKI
ncbi:TPA: iron-containing alcohol dehydrogenase family protein [Enterococcus faecium]|nr:iron-containing alcohol dehydrogenase family protein [Enterococcus faecium]HAR1393585.1 iron-containing alcohol dehydrogenase family protein [Enterococcus faecium]